MSVLIRGMEMPTSCVDCRFHKSIYCTLTDICTNTAQGCPLIPVPPHGALMDMDDFFATCPELVDGYKRITDDLVVIPAEEGE